MLKKLLVVVGLILVVGWFINTDKDVPGFAIHNDAQPVMAQHK